MTEAAACPKCKHSSAGCWEATNKERRCSYCGHEWKKDDDKKKRPRAKKPKGTSETGGESDSNSKSGGDKGSAKEC